MPLPCLVLKAQSESRAAQWPRGNHGSYSWKLLLLAFHASHVRFICPCSRKDTHQLYRFSQASAIPRKMVSKIKESRMMAIILLSFCVEPVTPHRFGLAVVPPRHGAIRVG